MLCPCGTTQVLECLEDLRSLEVLTLEGNPCSELPNYRHVACGSRAAVRRNGARLQHQCCGAGCPVA